MTNKNMTDALREVLRKSQVKVLEEDYSLIEAGKADFEMSEGLGSGEYFAMVSYGGKNTFVVPTRFVGNLDGADAERIDGWKVVSLGGDLPIELVGYIAEITGALVKAEVNLLCFSTFRTDMFLVKMEELDKAVKALNRLIDEAKVM
jgi:hypothetical protein